MAETKTKKCKGGTIMDNNSNISLLAPYYDSPESTPFTVKIGGTTYEVSTHFNPQGKQCVMEQFKELILSEKLI